jgi:hypothetical protein
VRVGFEPAVQQKVACLERAPNGLVFGAPILNTSFREDGRPQFGGFGAEISESTDGVASTQGVQKFWLPRRRDYSRVQVRPSIQQ